MIAVRRTAGARRPALSPLIAWRIAAACAVLLIALSAVAGHGRARAQDSVFELPAAQLRSTLGRTLAEHAFLTIEGMRTGTAEGEAFPGAGEALEANTQAVVGLIEAVYGADAAVAFGDLWRQHIGYVVDYARAVAEGDAESETRASEQLVQFTDELAALLAGANPHLTVDALTGLIELHVGHLQHVASVVEGNYTEAYPAVRETYGHMFTMGDGLANAIAQQFPQQFPGREQAFGPGNDLAIALERLIGEHTLLAILSTRAGLVDAPDLEAAVAALESNSNELEAAVSDIYGAEAGAAFGEMWRTHTGYYLDYVEAVQAEDEDARTEAADGLRDLVGEFSGFLAEANPNLPQDALEGLLGQHTTHLAEQVDAFHAEDYATSYAVTREAYAHAGEMARALAAAIAEQFPERFLPDTALPAAPAVPTAPPPGPVLAAIGVGSLLLGAFVGVRRRARS